MGFDDKDREKLTQVHTDVQWIKREHGQRLKNLETEDRLLHARINKVRNLYMGASAGVGVIVGAIVIWFRSLGGGK